MPEHRLARTRRAYDAPTAVTAPVLRLNTQNVSLTILSWRAPHVTAAEQLARRVGCNVIEGETDLP